MAAKATGAAVVPPGWDGAPGWLVLPRPAEASADAAELVQRALDEACLLSGVALPAGLGLAAVGWRLGISQLRAVAERAARHGLSLTTFCSDDPRSRVAAAAMGLQTRAPSPQQQPDAADAVRSRRGQDLTLRRGTLRSGDHLEAEGSVLVLGDVNPGARVSAGGHVLVWGRLRGMAHAGRDGDTTARIVALQLRPLQLRIADAVARGPEDSPPPGMAEEASLVDGMIQLVPAPPLWPLDAITGAGERLGLPREGPNLPRPQAQP